MTAHLRQQAGAVVSASKLLPPSPSTWQSQWPNLFLWHAGGVNDYILWPDLFPNKTGDVGNVPKITKKISMPGIWVAFIPTADEVLND